MRDEMAMNHAECLKVDDLLEIVSRIAPPSPFNRCKSTSRKLVAALRKRGTEAQVFRFAGHQRYRENVDPRWAKLPAWSWIHYAVYVPSLEVVLDPTWGQFETMGSTFRIASKDEYFAEWHETGPA